MKAQNHYSLSNLLKILTCLLAAAYLVNCFTPLRLHVDTLRYFAIKDCIELGCPKGSVADLDYLPYGYTALLILLSKAGILTSFTIVFINCLYLFGALYLTKKIFEGTINPYLFYSFVLLSWIMIKFTVHPLSEMQYLFFSMASLYFFYQFTRSKKISALILSFLFAGLAFITRSVGIALVAGLASGLCWQYRKELILLIKKYRLVSVILLLLGVATILFSKQLGLNHYTGVFNKQFDEGVGIGKILEWHFTEWAEISINTSGLKALSYLPGNTGKILFVISGIFFFACFIYLLFIRKTAIPFIIKSYLFFYIVLMFNWPFYDPRFWVPIFPLLVAILIRSSPFLSYSLFPKIVTRLVVGIYLILGVVSVGFITYTSLNKKAFVKKQANGVYRNEYEINFYGSPTSDTALHTDQTVLGVLNRYNK